MRHGFLESSGILVNTGIRFFLALTFCVAHGMMESWKNGIVTVEEELIKMMLLLPLDPIFQYSFVPTFQ